MTSIRVRVPATAANLGPGFDALGLAVQVYNFLTIEQSSAPEHEVSATGEGEEVLNGGHAEENIACQAACRLFESLGLPPVHWKLTLENAIPLARGLGSSSAARVGALVAANEWAKHKYEKSADVNTLLALATQLEGHPDNVAPALLGGLVVSTMSDPESHKAPQVLALRVPVAHFPRLVVFIPDSELETKEARAVLPDAIFLKDATFNIARASLLVGVLSCGAWQQQPELLREALQDKLHQEHRAALMPAYDCTVRAAIEAGAYGATLSGAGPTILAWLPHDDRTVSEAIIAMQEAAAECEVFGTAREVLIDNQGTVVV